MALVGGQKYFGKNTVPSWINCIQKLIDLHEDLTRSKIKYVGTICLSYLIKHV